jgi:hypothetical protein
MPSISLDSAYAPEVLEFWGRKYQETKEELEKLKVYILTHSPLHHVHI